MEYNCVSPDFTSDNQLIDMIIFLYSHIQESFAFVVWNTCGRQENFGMSELIEFLVLTKKKLLVLKKKKFLFIYMFVTLCVCNRKGTIYFLTFTMYFLKITLQLQCFLKIYYVNIGNLQCKNSLIIIFEKYGTITIASPFFCTNNNIRVFQIKTYNKQGRTIAYIATYLP